MKTVEFLIKQHEFQTTRISYQYKPQFHENDVGYKSSNFGLLVPSCSIPSMALPFLSATLLWQDPMQGQSPTRKMPGPRRNRRKPQEVAESGRGCPEFSDFRLLNIGKL